MASNIVLINPPPEQVVEEFDCPNYPHIGLAYLASSLEDMGYEPIVIDAKLMRMSFEETVAKVRSLSPQIIGITAMTHEITFAHELIASIKSEGCNSLVVIGGVHVSALPIDTLKEFAGFDIGVLGEGERTFVEICESVFKGEKELADVAGIVFRPEEGEVRITSERQFIEDLDALPPPAWHLFPKAGEYPIITARGCPAKCTFCAHSYGHAIRSRSPENILSEWRGVVESYQPERIRMYDESFGFRRDRAIKFLDLVINEGLVTPWFGYTRASIATPELLKKMQESGCYAVGIGVESGDPDILKKCSKGITLNQVERAVRNIHAAGMASEAYFILGFPHESPETIWRTIRFAKSLNPTKVAFGIMTPYPGTEIYRMAHAGEGGYKVLSHDWKDYNKQIGNALEIEGLPRKALEKYQLIGYLYHYLGNLRLIDFSRFAWRYRSEAFGFMRHHLRKR